ncbi:MAG: hypothetical protein ABR563_12085 [Pyrinomonadaceae bacterium]
MLARTTAANSAPLIATTPVLVALVGGLLGVAGVLLTRVRAGVGKESSDKIENEAHVSA